MPSALRKFMSDSTLYRMFHPKAKGKAWWAFVLIIILTIAGALIVFGDQYDSFAKKIGGWLPQVPTTPFHLGLDLLGGAQLTYKADVSAVPMADRTAAVDGVRDVIEKRVNVLGVSEPLVNVTTAPNGEYRIDVELAGVKNTNDAINEIGKTPLLEFREANNNPSRTLTAAQQKEMTDYNAQSQQKATAILGKLISGGDFAAMARQYSEDDTTQAKGGELGFINLDNYPGIAKAVQSTPINSFSKDLVKTANGDEIVKVEATRPAKEDQAAHILICYTGIANCDSGLSKDEALAKIQDLKKQATAKNFKDLAKANSTDQGSRSNGGELGWFAQGAMVKEFNDKVFAMKVGEISDPVLTAFGYHLIYKEADKPVTEYQVAHIFIKTKGVDDILGPASPWKNTELSGKDLQRASLQYDNTGLPEISLEFTGDGAKMFGDITGRNVNKQVAIFLDNQLVSAPTVNEKITGGKAVISGKFTLTEAQSMVKDLNGGALPAPITLLNQQTVGATLGQKSVDDSLLAGLIGLAIVALFMIIRYRLPGVLAVCALTVYSLLSLSVFKLWPVTMTLSGIAGFVLSVGMALDANILIFERMLEELRWGKSLKEAVTEGFSRAWPSIRDGNFNTIIVCLVLMQFSTSVLKGFAITLLLGVLISMFTAIVVTRNFLKLIPEQWLEKNHWLIGSKKRSQS